MTTTTERDTGPGFLRFVGEIFCVIGALFACCGGC